MPTELLLAMSGAFVLTAVVVGWTASWWMTVHTPEYQRVHALAGRVVAPADAGPARSLVEGLDPVLARLSRFVPKSPTEMNRLRRRLTRAGYPHVSAAVYYALAELLLAAAAAVAAIVFVGGPTKWVLAVAGAVIGYMLPGLALAHLVSARQKAIRNGLPDVLDLLTVCVEAGSALDSAIVKASEELRIAHPALADELRLVTTEMRAGKPRLEALKNLGLRTGVDDVRTLVAMLAQTDRFGTSIAQALRTHAETLRTKRRQAAEERAAKISVKLVFPLALCLFPAIYVVCFGPVVVKIYRAFFTHGM